MKRIIVLLLLLSFSNCKTANAQVYYAEDASRIVKGAELIKFSEIRQTIDYIKLNSFQKISEAGHLEWLSKTVLNCNDAVSFQLTSKETDQSGYVHYRYKQYYQSVPVEYGVYYVHVKNGFVISANGEYYDSINCDLQNIIPQTVAFDIATVNHPSAAYHFSKEEMINSGTLMIMKNNENYCPVWRFDIFSDEPVFRVYCYINALNGEIIRNVNRIQSSDATGTAVTGYNGVVQFTSDSLSPSNFRLFASKNFFGLWTMNLNHTTSLVSAIEFTDADNYWNATSTDQYAYDAHFAAEAAYDWYESKFNRNSYDNAGALIKSYIHYSNGFDASFWNGSSMVFGDGDVNHTAHTSVVLVGHEFAHAVTEHTANLVYSGQSGALNESFSDIFGTALDFHVHGTAANWLIGDEISLQGTPYRNLQDPKLCHNPDCYSGLYYDSPNDIHNNSGVQNHWFYLLSEGGTGVNDLGNSYLVNGIGIDQAADIAYRNLNVYLTPNSLYPDAAFYAVQSANDLYGACSSQEIETANAWYAVGIGSPISVKADFQVSSTDLCATPAVVFFRNKSFYGTSYTWYFGDGGTSNLSSPIHIYSTPGTYTITLIASRGGACNSDTLTYTNYISVSNSGGPVSANCVPPTNYLCCGIGIRNVNFGSINQNSQGASEGYKDFACSDSTTVIAGSPASVTITTGSTSSENVKVWIDYDNDGKFTDSTETAFYSKNKLLTHSGFIHVPLTAVKGVKLRMRVSDDIYTNTIKDPCYILNNGQVEDYAVTVINNTLPPVADFTSDNTNITTGDTIHFEDISLHSPDTWHWRFPGGLPFVSSNQFPSVVYNSIGIFPVYLTVTNSFGQDSIVRTSYVNVTYGIDICSGISFTNVPSGSFFDSGGSQADYSENQNCSLQINPGCVTSITVTFSQVAIGSGDYLRIYDGTSVSSPLLAQITGSTIPPPLTAASGKVFVTWTSNSSINGSGWIASWSSTIVTGPPPIAEFYTDTVIFPVGMPVLFTDSSKYDPYAWSWDFGDGSGGFVKNPTHIYSDSGTYQVTLIVYNCISTDTITHSVRIQSPPTMEIIPDTIFGTLGCGSSLNVTVKIVNNGNGDLVYNTIAQDGARPVNILAVTNGVDMLNEYNTTINAILSFYPNCNITKINTTDTIQLEAALSDKDIVLFAKDESAAPIVFQQFSNKIQSFINRGGTAIVCGGTYANVAAALGLFTGTSNGYITGQHIQINDTADALVDLVPQGFPAPYYTRLCVFTNTDEVQLCSYNSMDVVSYRKINRGRAVYLGFDYSFADVNASHIIANAVRDGKNRYERWLNIPAFTDTLHPGDTTSFLITMNAAELYGGIYSGNFILQSNDPLLKNINVPVVMNVFGTSSIALQDTCVDFGVNERRSVLSKDFLISNTGCDSLHVDMSTSGTMITVLPAHIDLPPYTSNNVNVNFYSDTIGTFNEILQIHYNTMDTTVCVSAVIMPPPVYFSDTDSITVNVEACEDSVIVPVYLHNSGGSDLHWNIITHNLSRIRVLVYKQGVDTLTEYPHTLQAIQNYLPYYTLEETDVKDTVKFQNKLLNADVVLFPSQTKWSWTFYPTFKNSINKFMDDGGNVVVCASSLIYANRRLQDMGLFNAFSPVPVSASMGLVQDTTIDIVNGIPQSFILPSLNYHMTFNDADRIKVVKQNNYEVVNLRHISRGKAIFLGWNYGSSNVNADKILANSLKYTNRKKKLGYLDFTSTSGTIAPGDSFLVNVVIHSKDIEGGIYDADIVIHTNDSLHLTDSVKLHVEIEKKPCTDFTVYTNNCSSTIAVQSTDFNDPNYWRWDFGDGTTSVLKYDHHTYLAAGTYDVKLLICNPQGCDSLVKQVVIISNSGPQPSRCNIRTTNYCCNRGITKVVFGSISHTSANANAGYEDFSCVFNTNLFAGSVNILTVTAYNTTEYVKAWIDFDNNGLMEKDSELVFGNVGTTHSGNVLIPLNAIRNIPLRMRIMDDDYFNGHEPQPCTDVIRGQAEDYSVTIYEDTLPPDADFIKQILSQCSGTVKFTDHSYHLPTAWKWYFGDGDTSVLQNPNHAYADNGVYTVKLFASNNYGIDSMISTVTISSMLLPQISFTGNAMAGQPLQFSVNAAAATYVNWTWGDGFTGTGVTGNHTYANSGTYYITALVGNSNCTAIARDTIIILPVGISELEPGNSFEAYPNPFNESIQLKYVIAYSSKVTLVIRNVLGEEIERLADDELQDAGEHSYLFKPVSGAVYFVYFTMNGKRYTCKIIKVE